MTLAAQILAGLLFLAAAPLAVLAWCSALPGDGSPGPFGSMVLIGIPVACCAIAAALLVWYGVPWQVLAGGVAAFTIYALVQASIGWLRRWTR